MVPLVGRPQGHPRLAFVAAWPVLSPWLFATNDGADAAYVQEGPHLHLRALQSIECVYRFLGRHRGRLENLLRAGGEWGGARAGVCEAVGAPNRRLPRG